MAEIPNMDDMPLTPEAFRASARNCLEYFHDAEIVKPDKQAFYGVCFHMQCFAAAVCERLDTLCEQQERIIELLERDDQ